MLAEIYIHFLYQSFSFIYKVDRNWQVQIRHFWIHWFFIVPSPFWNWMIELSNKTTFLENPIVFYQPSIWPRKITVWPYHIHRYRLCCPPFLPFIDQGWMSQSMHDFASYFRLYHVYRPFQISVHKYIRYKACQCFFLPWYDFSCGIINHFRTL